MNNVLNQLIRLSNLSSFCHTIKQRECMCVAFLLCHKRIIKNYLCRHIYIERERYLWNMCVYLCMHSYYCTYNISWTGNKLWETLKSYKDDELTRTRKKYIFTLVGVYSCRGGGTSLKDKINPGMSFRLLSEWLIMNLH